MKDQKF